MKKNNLTLLYDGACPFCLREVTFLRGRDKLGRIDFVDINSFDYSPESYSDITYRQAMRRVHAIRGNGDVIKGLDVFREAYSLINLGWIYAPTQYPILSIIFNTVYNLWAEFRLNLSGRPSLDYLCSCREKKQIGNQ